MSQPPAALSREGRGRCWAARDAFFQCLNVAGQDAPPQGLRPGEGACAPERAAYEKECPASWVRWEPARRVNEIARLTRAHAAAQVDYFNTRRMLEIRQRRTYEASERERNEKAAEKAAGRR